MQNVFLMKVKVNKIQEDTLKIISCLDQFLRNSEINYCLKAGSALGAYRHAGFIPWDDDLDILISIDDFDKLPSLAAKLKKYGLVYDAPLSPSNYNFFGKIRLGQEHTSSLNYKHRDGNSLAFVDVFYYSYMSTSSLIYFIQFLCSRLLVAYSLSFKARNYKARGIKRYILPFFRLIPMAFIKTISKFESGVNIDNPKFISDHLDGSGFNRSKIRLQDILSIKLVNFDGMQLPVPSNIEYYLSNLYGDYLSLPPLKNRIPKHIDELDGNLLK
jgi:lipopolysaccharide cholinephosphotransferase